MGRPRLNNSSSGSSGPDSSGSSASSSSADSTSKSERSSSTSDSFNVGFLVDVRVEFNIGLNVGFDGFDVGFAVDWRLAADGWHAQIERVDERDHQRDHGNRGGGGGINHSSYAGSDPAAPADQTVADATTTPPETPPEVPAAAEASRSASVAVSDRKRRQFEQLAGGARGVDSVTRSTAVSAAPSQPDISQVGPVVVDVAVNPPAAPQAVTALTASTYPVPQTNLVAPQPLSAAPTEPPGNVVSGVVSGVLGLAGLGPLAPDSPTPPVDSPVGWAVVALVRSRRFEQAVTEEASNLPSGRTLTSQTIDGVVTGDLTAAGDQGDRQALADTSTMQLSAPVSADVASATTTSTTTFAQLKAATPQTQQSGRAPAADTTAPTVNITGPAGGATVSGTVPVGANASDNKGVVGVQFLVNGAALGTEDKTAAYSVSWNTTTVGNGVYTLTAVARDAAGNKTTSAPVTVTVDNAAQIPVTITAITVNTHPSAVAISGNNAYVYGGDVISTINTTTKTVTDQTALYNDPPAITADGRKYVPNPNLYYQGNAPYDSVDVINTATGAVIKNIPLPLCYDCYSAPLRSPRCGDQSRRSAGVRQRGLLHRHRYRLDHCDGHRH